MFKSTNEIPSLGRFAPGDPLKRSGRYGEGMVETMLGFFWKVEVCGVSGGYKPT